MNGIKEHKVSYLFLDYNKPRESEVALKSIKENSHFDYQIIYLSNGGVQDYVWDFYKKGLIDRVIFQKNNGLGYGTEDLYRFCETEYAIYWQNDQILGRKVSQEEIDLIIQYLKAHENLIGAIGLAGPVAGETFSERANFFKTNFYNSIPKTHGGCGPFNHLKYNEQAVQEYFVQKNLKFVIHQNPWAIDNGVTTIRQLPCGGEVEMRTDTKQVWWRKLPKENYMFPDMTDEEWRISISGDWPDGKTPQRYIDQGLVFNCWGK
jgi:hypothetical protein